MNDFQKARFGMQVQLASRAVGIDDLDNDGDVDGVILNPRREATLLRNESPAQGHWLQVTLRGTRSNRDGVGAQVRIVTPDTAFMDEVHSGRSYQSDFGRRLYFGLGKQTKIDRIEVAWIGGSKEVGKGAWRSSLRSRPRASDREDFPLIKMDHLIR